MAIGSTFIFGSGCLENVRMVAVVVEVGAVAVVAAVATAVAAVLGGSGEAIWGSIVARDLGELWVLILKFR